MVAIKRILQPDHICCVRCDYYGFKPRNEAPWSHCGLIKKHFPKNWRVKKMRCNNFRAGGIQYDKNGHPIKRERENERLYCYSPEDARECMDNEK